MGTYRKGNYVQFIFANAFTYWSVEMQKIITNTLGK